MAKDKIWDYFRELGMEDRVLVFEESSATVELAAKAVGCETRQILKTMSFLVKNQPLLVVSAGTVRVDNGKFRARFEGRPKMIPADQVLDLVGFEIGGVSPFCVKEGVPVYLDESIRGNTTVYLGGGSPNSLVRVTLEELERLAGPQDWVDVCKSME